MVSEHDVKQKNGIQRRAKCRVLGCNCKQYEFSTTRNVKSGIIYGGNKNIDDRRKVGNAKMLYMSKLKNDGTPL